MVLKPSSSTKIPNLFLRRRRKWAHSPYKTTWHYIFNQQQALQTLKDSIFSSTHQKNPIFSSTDSIFSSTHQQDSIFSITHQENSIISSTHEKNPIFSSKNPNFSSIQQQDSIFSSTHEKNSIFQQKITQKNTTPCHILNCLINSFASYQCEPTPNAYNLILKTLIQKSQFNEVKFVLSHLQKVEKFDTPERVFVDLIRVYGKKGMIKEAINLFFNIPKFRCVPSVMSLNSLLLVLCRNFECLKFVPPLLLKCSCMNIRLEISSFSILINALCRINKVDFAIKLLNYMINDDLFDPDGKLYSLVLSSMCRQKSVNSSKFDVMCVLEDMKRAGFCPGREDYCNVIRFLGRQGEGNDAFGVLCEMKREGIRVDIICYNMVLYGLVEQGEFSRVEELFDEVLVIGLVPDVVTYNVYLKGLGKQKKVEDAYMMIGCMEELGCVPNLITYNTVLEGFCKVGELSRAREVWSQMQRKGMEFNHRSYSLMIEGLVSGGESEEACNMLDEMMSKTFVPTPFMSDMIIYSLCHKGLISEALCRLELVLGHGVSLGPASWEALLVRLNLDYDQVGDLLVSLVNLLEIKE